jgi:putative ABC transport system ATP-binding protein
MNALRFTSVSKTRGSGRNAVQALTEVSLAIEPGEFVLLEGPSGSGKTTVLAVAAGLLPADRGEVSLAEDALASLDAAALRRCRSRRVGFVFQHANLLASLSARHNVVLAGLLAGAAPDEAERRSDELLLALGVAALASRHPGELSGGEQQRVAVARALVHRPAVVLADEPTAHLDRESGRIVADRLRILARERNAAVLVATHDSRLEEYADRIIRLEDGRVV